MNRARPSELPYRSGVGIILLDRRGRVFVGRRIDTVAEAWQLPQGGIDTGETPLQAARRELAEETGVTSAELLAESADWYTYDLPAELIGKVWGGRYRGQRQKWFVFRFTGADDEIDIATEHPEFNGWKWIAIDDLPATIVPFKRRLYERLVADFRHLARPADEEEH